MGVPLPPSGEGVCRARRSFDAFDYFSDSTIFPIRRVLLDHFSNSIIFKSDLPPPSSVSGVRGARLCTSPMILLRARIVLGHGCRFPPLWWHIGSRMSFGAAAFRPAILIVSTLFPQYLHAEEIDTEHIYAFTIGTDVGSLGEREFQSQTTGRVSKSAGSYAAVSQEIELEFVPVKNFRIEVGSSLAGYDISGVPALADRSQVNWQGASLDLRYRLFDRRTAPIGLTFALETQARQIDELTGAFVRNYATEMTLALERELIADRVVATLNLSYEPEWTRFSGTGLAERESTDGVSFALMTQVRPGLLIGGEARYLRRYEGPGLENFAGQAFFAGPTGYWQMSEQSRLTLGWSAQIWGRPAASSATLDLTNFERHQARVIFGFNF